MRELASLLPVYYSSFICCTGHKSVGISLASGKCILFEVSFSVPIARVLVSVLPVVTVYYL